MRLYDDDREKCGGLAELNTGVKAGQAGELVGTVKTYVGNGGGEAKSVRQAAGEYDWGADPQACACVLHVQREHQGDAGEDEGLHDTGRHPHHVQHAEGECYAVGDGEGGKHRKPIAPAGGGSNDREHEQHMIEAGKEMLDSERGVLRGHVYQTLKELMGRMSRAHDGHFGDTIVHRFDRQLLLAAVEAEQIGRNAQLFRYGGEGLLYKHQQVRAAAA